MPQPAMVTNTDQSQVHTLCPSTMTNPVGRVYMPMISGAKLVAFIALKKSAHRRGWAAWESPTMTSDRANQASMYGAMRASWGEKGGFQDRLISGSPKVKIKILISQNIFAFGERPGTASSVSVR